MKAYLIDPVARAITEVTLETGSLQELYDVLQVEMIEAVYIGPGNHIYVDEEGLLKPQVGTRWRLPNSRQWLVGRGLVLGSGRDGSEVSTSLSMEQVQEMVIWQR